jgi:hypothetical protein
MTGVTRQWVTTSLKRFAELGIVDPSGANLVIKDAELLKKIRDGRLAKIVRSNNA